MISIREIDRRSGLDRRAFSDYKGSERRTTDRRSGTDRRESIRYSSNDIVLVKLKSEIEEEVGQLLDISERGLSAYFSENIDRKREYSEMEIFPFFHDFTIRKIPFSTVSETELDNESQLSTKKSRRQCLRFERLTSEQKVKLDYLLRNYTLGNG